MARAQKRIPPAPEKSEAIVPAKTEYILNSSETEKLINSQVVKIIIEKDDDPVREVKELMEADLNYNKKRLEILREHAEKDPSSIEQRKTGQFRRTQYALMLFSAFGMIIAIPFFGLATAAIFGILSMCIVSGTMVNARDRELDLAGFVKLFQSILEAFMRRTQ